MKTLDELKAWLETAEHIKRFPPSNEGNKLFATWGGIQSQLYKISGEFGMIIFLKSRKNSETDCSIQMESIYVNPNGEVIPKNQCQVGMIAQQLLTMTGLVEGGELKPHTAGRAFQEYYITTPDGTEYVVRKIHSRDVCPKEDTDAT